MAKRWSAELELVGAGGEPVDLWRTLASHGVADLPPNVDRRGRADARDDAAAPARARAHDPDPRGQAGPRRRRRRGRRAPVTRPSSRDAARHMLRLDADLSGFYEAAREDPDLAWVCSGAGRMLRSPTVFEDVVKTICTTNCAWSATVRMTSALVAELGRRGARSPPHVPEPGGDGRGDRRLLQGRRPRRLPRAVPARDRRGRRRGRARPRGPERPASCPTTRSPSGSSRCPAAARTRPRT